MHICRHPSIHPSIHPFIRRLYIKYINNYELLVSNYCKQYEFKGVITGHIHKPADKYISDVHYLNCGDWLENNTAVIETLEGELKLIKL